MSENKRQKIDNPANDYILITCECAPNIALIKYWGKSNEELIIPLNSSISVTLDRNVLCSKTSLMLINKRSAEYDASSKDIRIWFDGSIQEFNENEGLLKSQNDLLNRKRFMKMLNKVRSECDLSQASDYAVRICSKNNFPTACGLASSASGFSCLALCLAHAFKYRNDVSELARLGSGSACRSCYGGFVEWYTSTSDDQEKLSKLSIAKQLFKSSHWPELNILVFILHDRKKDVSSTDGMQNSVKTSELLAHRVKIVEEKRLKETESAIKSKDFSKLGEIIMRDSNCFHSVCSDTYPPLFYLNEKSKEIIRLCHQFNKSAIKVAYSFDAGPNAFLFVLDEHLNEFLSLVKHLYFANTQNHLFLDKRFVTALNDSQKNDLLNDQDEQYLKQFDSFKHTDSDFINYILHSKIGNEPNIIDSNGLASSLLNEYGEPMNKTSSNGGKRVLSNNLTKKRDNKFNVYIVEDHNEALNEIYKEIGSKHICYDNLLLVHFDSHPDLGLDRSLNKKTVFSKENLLNSLSIENWILPATVAGHINKIIWVKPYWSKQIDCGKYEFFIGYQASSGCVRLNCKEMYFVNELLYANEADLCDKKRVLLYVCDLDELLNDSLSFDYLVEARELLYKQDSGLKQTIVDVDLDFFSTLDPFKEMFIHEDLYNVFKSVYMMQGPSSKLPDSQFESEYLKFADEKPAKLSTIFDKLSGYIEGTNKLQEDRDQLIRHLGDIIKKQRLSLDIIHGYGEGIDNIGLPHHKSTCAEIIEMINFVEKFYRKFFIDAGHKTPSLVTIARSSLDDYCPPDQVDFIQNEFIKCLQLLFADCIKSINYNY